MDDPNAAVVTVFGSGGHNTHPLAVPLDDLARLKLVVEASGRPLGGPAVDVNDVVERACHNRLGHTWARQIAGNGYADERT